MKWGICIDNEHAEGSLTIGKAYILINNDGQLVDVVDDNGETKTVVVERFERLEGKEE